MLGFSKDKVGFHLLICSFYDLCQWGGWSNFLPLKVNLERLSTFALFVQLAIDVFKDEFSIT
jgi:hypothetical protein